MIQGIDDRELSVPEYSEVCTFCKHVAVEEKRKCAAFTEIPLSIWLGENNHAEPYPGDHGIQFAPVENA